MSERRARSGSLTEVTDSKRRATVTEPVEEFQFTFCDEGVTSPIDDHFAIFQSDFSPIFNLYHSHNAVKLMVAKIVENQFDLLAIAIPPMKAFLKFVDDKVMISKEDADNLLRGVWLHPCFVQPLAAAMHDAPTRMLNAVMGYQKQASFPDRVANMEADFNFRPSVELLKAPTSRSTFVRLFLSILLGHWGGAEGVLRELDQKMNKNVFGRRLNSIARMKAIAIKRAGKEDEIEEFSYVVDDINGITRANVMDPLRKLMVERYGQREDRDIEAILEKTGLYDFLSITRGPLGYGGNAKICVTVVNGRSSFISMKEV